MQIRTKVWPLFSVTGTVVIDDEYNTEVFVYLYSSYEEALQRGKEMLHQNNTNVSVDRVKELDEQQPIQDDPLFCNRVPPRKMLRRRAS